MLREKINKIFNNKALYMAFSVVAAILLWAYVTNIENQDMDSTIPGIIVTFTGQEKMLSEHSLIVDPNSNYSVALKVMGKRDVISRLNNSNVTVSVDLSDISAEGSYNRLFTVNLPSSVDSKDVYVLSRIPEYVSVRAIQYETRSVIVKGAFTGTFREGCEAKPMEFSPASVTVGGPKSIISQIDCAWVNLNEADVGGTLQKTTPYIFVNAQGEKIPMTDLKLDRQNIDVTMPVIMKKDVRLAVNFISGGGASAENVSSTISPSTIELSGDPEVLEDINEITIHTFKLSEVYSDLTEVYNIPIPAGLTASDNQTRATVRLTLKGLGTRSFQISNVQFTNLFAGHKATLVQPLEVTLRGAESVISNVNAEDISVSADFGSIGQTLGQQTVDVNITISNRTGVATVGNYKATVLIESEGQSGTDTEAEVQQP